MAVTETRALPAKFIEELGTDYAGQLKAATAKPNSITTTSNSINRIWYWILSTIFNTSTTSRYNSWHWFRFSTNRIRNCRTRINRSRNNFRNCRYTINRSTISFRHSRNYNCRCVTIY
jgi:hypothetical protein